MSKSSKLALLQQVYSGKMESDGAYILAYIKRYTERKMFISLPDLEKEFTMKTATIVARLSGLEDRGYIFKDGTTKITVGDKKVSYSKYYFEPDDTKQSKNREEVNLSKFRKSVNNLIKRFPEFVPLGLEIELTKSLNVQQKLF